MKCTLLIFALTTSLIATGDFALVPSFAEG